MAPGGSLTDGMQTKEGFWIGITFALLLFVFDGDLEHLSRESGGSMLSARGGVLECVCACAQGYVRLRRDRKSVV